MGGHVLRMTWTPSKCFIRVKKTNKQTDKPGWMRKMLELR